MKKIFKKLLQGKAVGFTLAEVLLTLAIIGIVTALTVPPLVQEYNQRAWTSASSTFERKLGETLKIMYAKNTLVGHQTTRDFINELGKNLKIMKVCNQVTDCFTTSITKKSNNGTTTTSDLTSSAALGHFEFGTEAVGVQFASGVNAIIAYNKNYSEPNVDKIVRFSTRSIGSNKAVKLLTNTISVVYDVNAFDIPNKSDADIFRINSSISGSIGGCLTDTSLGSYCIKVLGTDYQPLNCQVTKLYPEYCGPYSSGYDKDYWAGAKKACEDEGMTLPSAQDLKNIWTAGSHIDSFVPTSGHYFSSDSYPKTNNYSYMNNAYTINFSNGGYGNSSNTGKKQQHNVLCMN